MMTFTEQRNPRLHRFARVLAAIAVCAVLSVSHAAERFNLNGGGWEFRTARESGWRPVNVPHCWPLDNGYLQYVGEALYRRNFTAPLDLKDKVVRLRFEAVYYKAVVRLNGTEVGAHEGGYTPFEFDVTKLVRPGTNQIEVAVDNSWGPKTLPIGNPDGTQRFAWWSYGGIVRDVTLLVTPQTYIANVKIESTPDLEKNTAALIVRAWVRNASAAPAKVTLGGEVAAVVVQGGTQAIGPGETHELKWTGSVERPRLWDWRDPHLYDAVITAGGDTWQTHIGIRKVEVRGTQLLLNGRPIRLFGANRHSDHPRFGLIEPQEVVEQDMGLMLESNMRFMRIGHHAQAVALLDYADRHGILLVEEAANWQLNPAEMDDPDIGRLWQQQMREMVERDWNHPSIIAWSVGNEYDSHTPSGVRWTREAMAFTRGVDSTRLLTFASNKDARPQVKGPQDEASFLSDFVCLNIYGNHTGRLDHAHSLWPDKPIFVSEFGRMGDEGLEDVKRVANLTAAIEAMKARPYVIGGGIWAFSDYRSRHPGTPPSGYRPWGVITPDRERRASFEAVKKMFAPDGAAGR